MSTFYTPTLPNVKKLFIPDPGYLIADVDLDRADLQVVCWEADDEDLKRRLRMGVDLHICNGLDVKQMPMPPEEELIPTHPEYPEHVHRYAKERKFAKTFVHGTNYGGGAPTMARNCGITVKEAERGQAIWFAAHPGIKDWHDRTEQRLLLDRTVANAFGFHFIYFDRIQGVLPQALAWVPQSTVAIVTNTGLANLDNHLPEVEMLLQVHDSVVFQYESKHDSWIRPRIREELSIVVPYPDPLIIPVGLLLSAKSWGDCSEAQWEV